MIYIFHTGYKVQDIHTYTKHGRAFLHDERFWHIFSIVLIGIVVTFDVCWRRFFKLDQFTTSSKNKNTVKFWVSMEISYNVELKVHSVNYFKLVDFKATLAQTTFAYYDEHLFQNVFILESEMAEMHCSAESL